MHSPNIMGGAGPYAPLRALSLGAGVQSTHSL